MGGEEQLCAVTVGQLPQCTQPRLHHTHMLRAVEAGYERQDNEHATLVHKSPVGMDAEERDQWVGDFSRMVN